MLDGLRALSRKQGLTRAPVSGSAPLSAGVTPAPSGLIGSVVASKNWGSAQGSGNAMVVIVMGVTGAGKSTIGNALAASLGWEFCDGDDLHSAESKRKMHRGEALTDLDRAPWIAAVRGVVEAKISSGVNGVVACSALKQAYREEIVGGLDPALVRFVYLKGSEGLIGERLARRIAHFMNPQLLQSQFDTLEEPDDRDAIVVDISVAPEAIVGDIRARLRNLTL